MKFCPLISNVVRVGIGCGNYRNEFEKTPCQKDECEFWLSACHWFDDKEPQKCDPSDCDEEGRDYMECKGGCRLI
jgi:hypothetical protein